MSPHATCKVAIRLIGILIAGLCLSQAWHAAHNTFFNRVWFGLYTDWLWPFTSYDSEALDDLGHLIQFGLAMTLIFAAGPISRLVMRGIAHLPGQCGKCGYDIRGVSGGACPECGAAIPAQPIH